MVSGESTSPDPINPLLLEYNYESADRNVRLLARWYECEPRRLIAHLATHSIDLSAADARRYGSYYRSVRQQQSEEDRNSLRSGER